MRPLGALHTVKNVVRLTIHSDLTFVLKVAFVGDDDDWEGVLVLDTKDLLVESADFLE